jgi:phospholipid-binding lipoprotein MlaA
MMQRGSTVHRLAAALLLSLLGLLGGGCATVPATAPGVAATSEPPSHDPWERMNRQIFEFNEVVDQVAIKPVAQVYQAVVPEPARRGVRNFFGNLGDFWTAANLMLQAKPRQSLEMFMRAEVNTVFGLGGLLEVADDMGLERFTVEDMGQTLGFWGLKSGPYLVLPFLGPNTLRDTVGLLLDYQDSTINRVWQEPRDRNAAGLLNLLSRRVELLNASRVLDQIALDKYVLLRDAYLARRKSQLYDGDVPDEADGAAVPAPFKSRLQRETPN